MTPIFISTISIFYLGLLPIFFNRLHFLSILLCLELLLISLFLSITIWALNAGTNFFVANNLILLTLSACEASAGLSLMVALSRTHNLDLVIALNILQQ
uniref:NADH-ubiquinone oxidoreductase chain 4L n=1 Tax=Acanthaster brevispinus TaxID=339859 RepID=Q2L672_ACABR|nr:NADH dehydrogenase subunit 4L [Acanthaster brevispinus]BAE79182.1 NADH dehydrogenase subunit 4L [Acanthaster brevispinus]